MELAKIWTVSLSPTGNTERTVRLLAETLADRLGCPVEHRGFTTPAERAAEQVFRTGELVVIGAPAYAGRLPNKLAPELRQRLRSSGALAVAVVTFGNRSYDNALAELCALLTGNGFQAVAAGAFAAQHAMTDALGYGRPGWSDQLEIKRFADRIAGKVRGLAGTPEPLSVPGEPDAAYYIPRGTDGRPVDLLKAKPKTDGKRCNGCGACARRCPMGAIDPKEVSRVPGTCIKCQRCVVKCTRGAKYFDDPALLDHVAMLERDFAEPKENEVFL